MFVYFYQALCGEAISVDSALSLIFNLPKVFSLFDSAKDPYSCSRIRTPALFIVVGKSMVFRNNGAKDHNLRYTHNGSPISSFLSSCNAEIGKSCYRPVVIIIPYQVPLVGAP